MIRFQCPRCNKKLGVQESQAGEIGTCPECKCKFRIPAPPADEAITGSPRRRPAPHQEDAEPTPAPRKRKRVEEDEDLSAPEEEEERRPARKKKKKRRRRTSPLLLGLDSFTITLIGLGVVGLLSLVLALIARALAPVPFYMGNIIMVVGGIWFLVVAFQDSAAAGLLCLFIPFYSLYYLITHFDETKRPFFLQLAGLVLFVGGILVGGTPAQSGPTFGRP